MLLTYHYTTREPTDEETLQILAALVEAKYTLPCPADMLAERDKVRVLVIVDHYSPDTPGYSGPVGIAMYGGDPGFLTVLGIGDDGNWTVFYQFQPQERKDS